MVLQKQKNLRLISSRLIIELKHHSIVENYTNLSIMKDYQGKTKQSIDYSIDVNLYLFLAGSVVLLLIIIETVMNNRIN